MKYILGSGITGLLAKYLLPGDWQLIPVGRSRFYSYTPSLFDDYIIRTEKLTDIIESIATRFSLDSSVRFFHTKWSVGGALMASDSIDLVEQWLYKVYQDVNLIPSHYRIFLPAHLTYTVYNFSVRKLYESLITHYRDELLKPTKVGRIGDHWIEINGQRKEFTELISTIPAPALARMMGSKLECKTLPTQLIHIRTDQLDLEGADRALVVDDTINFYKVDKLSDVDYLFYFRGDEPYPAKYLMNFIPNFTIVNGTTIPDYLVCGDIIKADLESLGIRAIGTYAQWDACTDVGSDLIRLLKLETS